MATIKDIAREIGISPSVVSRALNQKYGVNEQTRALVVKTAAKMKYYPHAAARSLVTRKTETIGIMVADLSEPFYSQIIKGMEYVASETGYTLLFSNSYENLTDSQGIRKMVEAEKVDGLIIIGSNVGEKSFIFDLLERKTPFVLIERNFSDPCINCIWVDNVQGASMAVNHLIGKGHRRIAHISGNLHFQSALDRMEGYKTALLKAGLPFVGELVATGKFLWQDGYAAMKELLQNEPRPTAVFAANDAMAYGALQAIAESGLSAPRDLAIVGFDDLEFSGLTNPPLTTICQPRYEMGEKAMRILVGILRDGPQSVTRNKICFVPELVLRGSA